jgi:hypothetical protein
MARRSSVPKFQKDIIRSQKQDFNGTEFGVTFNQQKNRHKMLQQLGDLT